MERRKSFRDNGLDDIMGAGTHNDSGLEEEEESPRLACLFHLAIWYLPPCSDAV